MKKIILIIVLLAAITNGLFAQDNYSKPLIPSKIADSIKINSLSNEELFEKSDYILEIKWTGNINVYDALGNESPNDIYTRQSCRVTYVYKGESSLVGSVIELIKKAGVIDVTRIDEEGMKYYDVVKASDVDYGGTIRDNTYIIFCVKSDYPQPLNKEDIQYKRLNLKFTNKKASSSLSFERGIRGLNDLSFPNRDSLYSYMQQYEKYGVNSNAYYDEAEKYYQQKRKEIDEFKKNYPNFEIPDTIKGHDALYKFWNEEMLKTDLPSPKIINFKEIKKIQELQTEINEFVGLKLQKRNEFLKEINRRSGGDRTEPIKKKMIRTTNDTTKLWVIINNQNVYYDNINNKNYLEFDYSLKSNIDNIYLVFVLYYLQIQATGIGEEDIIENAKITITPGIDIDPTTYSLLLQSYSVSNPDLARIVLGYNLL